MIWLGHHHNDHSNTGNRAGKDLDLDCYCVPVEQCPSTSVMNVFGATSNHIQHNNVVNNHHHHSLQHSSNNNRLQEGTNHVNNGFANNQNQRPSRQQLPEKDYSNLINPRTLPKEIVASASNINEGAAEVHDTLDLSGQENFESNRARYSCEY